MIIPDWQKPHCGTSSATHAFCTGCEPSAERPSIVTILAPAATAETGITQLRVGAPSICTVHIDGVPTRSCVRPVSTVGEAEKIVTIEGLAPKASHALQRSWVALDVPQCGFCQSGMIMAAAALLKAKPKPTDADIDEAMTNICRCGTYQRIREAVHQAAGNPAGGRSADRATRRS